MPGCVRRLLDRRAAPVWPSTARLRHIHVQLINDANGTTVAAASSIEADVRGVEGDKKARSVRVGQPVIAERAKAAGVEDVVFDRGLHLRRTHRGSGGCCP